MATQTIVIRTDDIDGSEGATNVRFSLDGAHFEIDLNEEHAGDLREALALYIGNARKISAPQAGGARRAGSSSAPASRDYDPRAVRAWATEHGIEVPARGRVPLTVIESYRQAHGAA